MKTGKRNRLQRKLMATAVAAWLAGPLAYANPVGPVVVSGQATFAASGNQLAVTNAPGTIINWQQFSIQSSETTRFIQPSAASAVLNRVVGIDPSLILGTLQSNGRVFLINPNGILFGAGSRIDVAGLVASTLNLTNENFLAGRMNFAGGPAQAAALVNQGRISARSGGQVFLLGSAVDNQGVITAANGDIVLAAGQSVRVTDSATAGLQVAITAPADRALNLSEVTHASRGIYAGLIMNSGTISADSVVRGAGGSIILKAGKDVTLESGNRVAANGADGGRIVIEAQDTAAVTGNVEATGSAGRGGNIAITGARTGILDGASIDASGAGGGGSVLIGGDLHGAAIRDGDTGLLNSQLTYVAAGARIRANALASGDGGKVVVWSDAMTAYHGAISARGGAAGGNGGAVEVSGQQSLVFRGGADTRAPKGTTGTLLLDPLAITIQAGTGDGNDADALNNSFAGSPSGIIGTVLAADATPTTLFQSELQGIAATTNISLAATNSITINALTGGNLNLAQSAGHGVTFQAGTFSMNAGDTITTAGGALGITTTAGGAAIGSLATNGGAITLNVAGASTVDGVISGTGTTLTKQGAGMLTLNGANTYTGLTTVSAGTLNLNATGANSIAGNLTVAGGSAVLQQPDQIANAATVIVAGGTLDIGANNDSVNTLQLTGGSLNGSGGILTSSSTYDLQAGAVSAILGGAVGANKSTAGTVTFTGANTYTGLTTVSAGTLNLNTTAANAIAGNLSVAGGTAVLQQSSQIPDTASVAVSAGTLNIGANSDTVSGVQLTGGSIGGSGGTLTSASAFDVQAGSASAILGGSIGITKSGAGTVTLSGTNTYTGVTTINAGTLSVATIGDGGIAGNLGAATAAAGNLVLGGGTLQYTGANASTNRDFTLTIGTTSTIDVTANNLTLTGAGAATNGALTKLGAGILTFAGANSYTGLTTVGAGTLNLNTTAANSIAGNLSVAGGSTVLQQSSQISDTASVAVSVGTLNIGANSDTVGGVQLTGGSISGSGGTLTSTSAFDLQAGAASAILGGTIGVTKTGAGTVILSGVNTYTGVTTINAGTLSVATIGDGGIAGNLGAATAAAANLVLGGGTLQYTGANASTNRDFTLTSGTTSSIDVTANNLTLTGVGAATNGALTKLGAGALTFTTANIYTGSTTVSAGTLNLNTTAANSIAGNLVVAGGSAVLQQSDQISNAATVVVSGGTLNIGANSDTVNGVQLTGGSINGSGGTLTSASNFDLQAGAASAILGGSIGITKTGAGTVTLSGVNTYTGVTTINAGTLSVATIGNGGVAGNLGAATALASNLVLGGGTLQYTGANASTNRDFTLTTGTTSSIDVTANNLTLTGVGAATNGALTKLGAGTLTLTTANTYTGLTTASAGTLNLNTTAANSIAGNLSVAGGSAVLLQSNQIPDTASVAVSAGTLNIGANSDTVGGVQLTGGSINGSGGTLTSASTFDLQAGAASAILAGATAGVGATKTGAGTVTLSGVNTYTGVTTINAGTLSVATIGDGGVAGNLGAATAAATNLVLGGGTLQYTGANASTNRDFTLTTGTTSSLDVTASNLTLTGSGTGANGALTKSGAGTLTFNTANTYTGLTTVSAGTLAYGTSNALATGGVTVDGATAVLALGTDHSDTVGTVTVANGGSITGTGTSTLTSTATFEMQSGSVSAILAGAGIVLNKTTGGTVTLSGANTYTGLTTVSAGILNLNTAAANAIAGNLTISGGSAVLQRADQIADTASVVVAGGTLDIGANNDTVAGVQLLSGSIIGTTGTLTSATNFDLQAGSVGAILGGSVGITKSGAGTVILSRSNTFTGASNINDGTLAVTANNALGTTDAGTNVAATGTLDLRNVNYSALEAVTLNGGTLATSTGTSIFAGPVTLNANSSVVIDGSQLTLQGVISENGGSFGLTKTGTGALTFTAANTYTGLTTVSAGTLNLNTTGANSIAGNLIVSGGSAVLQKSNQIANTSSVVVTGGTLDIGANSDTVAAVQLVTGSITGTTGTLTSTTDFDLQAGSVSAILGGAVGANKTTAGTVTLSGANTYTGLTTVSAGTLNLNTTGANSIAGNLTVSGGSAALQKSNQVANTSSVVVTGGTLDLGANSDTVAAVQLVTGSITGTTGTLTSTSDFDLQAGGVSAILGGTVGANKTTAGTATFTGANTYTGLTTVSAGTLNLNTTGANSIAGNLTVSGGSAVLQKSNQIANTSNVMVAGGTLDLGANSDTVNAVQLTSGNINGSGGTLTSTNTFDLQAGAVSAILGGAVGANKTTAGTVTFAGANTYTGLTTVSAGTLNLSTTGANSIAGNLTVSGGTAVLQQSNQIANTASVVVAGGTLDIGANSDTVNAVQLTSGNISGSGGTLTSASTYDLQAGAVSAILGGVAGANKTTAGTVTLTGANTYTGLTTVSAGTLNLNTTGANSIAGNLTVSGGAAVLQQSNQIANTASVVVSGGTLDLGANSDTVNAVQLTGGNISGSGGTLTSTNTFDLQAGAVSAILGGAAGANKTTAGTVTFTGANTYTGLTTVSAGTLNLNTTGANSIAGNLTVSGGTAVLQQSNQIANTASVVVAGGTLDIGANSDTVNAVQLTGGNISGSGGTLTSTSAFDLQAGAVSAILGGAVGANKTTAGTVTLSGATTYTGLTTVSAGTLNLNTTGANSIAGNLTVSGGAAVLQQSNQIADTASVIVSGGTLDIGANSNTVAAVQLAAGSITGTAGTLTSSSDFDLRSGSVSAILGGSVGVAKNSAGAVTLSRDNTYAGATSINAGTLTVSAGNALGTTGAGTTVSSGATLAINNTALAAEPVTLNGDGVSGAGALTGTGTASLAGNVTLTTASTIGVTAGADALTLSGTVEGPGALSLIGAGTVTLGGTAGNATALASLTQNAATTLKLNGGLMRTAGDQTYNGPVTANGATTLRTTANGAHGNIAVNGVMTATAGTLTLDTGTGNAMLDNVLNDFGTVQVTSGGTVSLVDANALTVGASSVGRITALTRSLDLTLGGNITAAGGGNSIVLVAKRNFLNPGAKTLDPGAGGRWLVYSTNPAADTRGGLLYDFKQYNATFGVTPVAQPAGNGFLYTVAPSVTPSLTGTVTKVYDGTADATLNAVNYSFSGTLDGDTITLGNATSGAYDDRHVGAGKPVTVSGLTVGGASNGLATVYGYQLASAAASANIGVITPATLTVTANNQAKTYGTTLTFTGGEFTPAGLQNGETIGSVTLAGAGAASTAHVAVVPYSITASAATGGTFTPSDYTISYVNGALTVNPATLTVTANDQVKAYGTQFNFAGSEFASSGLKNGEMIGSVTLASAGAPATAAATTPVAAPPYPIVASAAAGGTFTAGDYAISYVPGAFTVNAAGVALTVTANNLSKTYGTTLIFTGSEFSATGLQNGEMIGSVTMTSTGAAGAAPVAGNPYAITPIAATGGTFTSSNYTISYVNGALTVVPAPLTIQADNKSRLPNSANPVFTATYTGFQLGETPATPGALTGVLVFKTTAAVSSPSGTYPIVASGQTSNNYAITYVDGTLTIQPSSYEGLLTDLLAAMRRLGIEDYGADIAECLGAGSGAGSAASMAAAPRGVAAKPQRKCSGSASGPSAPAKVIQPPRR